MQATDVEEIIKKQIKNIDVRVQSDGSHYQIIAISEAFSALNPVKKQQLIYGCLNSYIMDGTIHAVIIKAYTPDEWSAIS